jgi:dihydrofolate reductase
MKITIIAAVGSNLAIGNRGKLPWEGQLPADLDRFKKLTTGHPVIMGRKTHESIGRKLPNRINIVITSRYPYHEESCCIQDVSLIGGIGIAARHDRDKIFIIGGARIFEEAIKLGVVNEIELTYINRPFEATVFFPRFFSKEWFPVFRENHTRDLENKYDYSFIRYERRQINV